MPAIIKYIGARPTPNSTNANKYLKADSPNYANLHLVCQPPKQDADGAPRFVVLYDRDLLEVFCV